MNYNYWNTFIPLSKEIIATAVEGDLVYRINNIVFLIQRTGDENNIICFKDGFCSSFASAIMELRSELIKEEIQYVRIEGNTRRYGFLIKMGKEKGFNVVKDTKASMELNRNVFYIKVY